MASADDQPAPLISSEADNVADATVESLEALRPKPPLPREPIRTTRRWPRTRVVLVAGIAVIAFLVIAIWLMQPSPNAAFAVSARTGSATLEPLCGERLVWDLPAGRVVRRSAMPNATDAMAVGNVTLVLAAGSRVRLESTSPGDVRIVVGPAGKSRSDCSSGSDPAYQISVNEVQVGDDPIGFSYAALPVPSAEHAAQLSLLASGHVVLGEPVQVGAGWATREPGILESGTVDLRVIPWFGDDRVTLRTELLEEGSLFDTHACLGAAADQSCPPLRAPPARGFLRTLPDGKISVQLYVRGAVGTQSFGGDQHVLRIPESTAAWHSPQLMTILSLLIVFFGFYQGVKTIVRDGLEWWRGERSPVHESEGVEMAMEATHMALERGRESERSERPRAEEASGVGAAVRRTLAIVMMLGCSAAVGAEPVEIRQGELVGAGYSFRRGTSCLVVTARHVVPGMGVAVTVFDRGGAKAVGTRAYDNEFYDLALIALPDSSTVACTSAWPDSVWLARASFAAASEFRAVRHYSSGRETIVRLRYAGGIKHLLTLAPADKLTIRESDSGAMVELDGRLVGIVQSLDTATDRVNVLRFDMIDQLVGDRFRRAKTNAPLSYAGVYFHGRANPDWSTYVQSWLTEKAGRTVIAAPDPLSRPDPRRPVDPPRTAAATRASCEVKVEVMSWERVSVPNPNYASVELAMKSCGKRGLIFEQLCQQARRSAANTPRQVLSQKLTLNVSVTPKGSTPLTKLATSTIMPPSGPALGRTELELAVLQAAVGPALKELLDLAPCQ